MSLTRKIAHNTIIQIVGKVVSTFLGLTVLAMMTRYLGTEKFGWYITTIAFLQFIGILTDFGMIVVTSQMLSEPFHNKEKLFKNLFAFRFFTSLFFLTLAPFIALFFPYPPEVKLAIGITTISFFSMGLNQIFTGLYQTRLKMHIHTLGEFTGRIILIIGIWLLIQNDAGFLPIITMAALSTTAFTFVLWTKARKETKVAFAFDMDIWKKIIIKMWPIALSIIFNVVYLKGDLVLLSVFVSQSEVGIYGAAYRVLDVITQSAMMIMGVLLPLLAFSWSRKQIKQFRKRYQQAFDIMMVFAIPMMCGIAVLSNKIINLVAGEEFAGSEKILAILSIAVFGVFLGAVFGHTAVAINKQKQTLWIYISSAIITLIGYLIFIPKFGIYGAAWMSVFSEIYVGILLFFTIRHFCREKLILKTFYKIIFSSVIMVLAIKYTINLNILLNVILGVTVYGIMMLVTKAISQKTIKEIISINKG
jgi:O-antigen/teichoic acid export membrane protein